MARISSGTLIGREAEFSVVADVVAGAAAGHPSALFLMGEAGIGKSRLLREVSDRAQQWDAQVISGGCIPVSRSALPYAPVITALRQGMTSIPRDEVENLPSRTRSELSKLLPELGTADQPVGEATQNVLFDAVLTLLRLMADASTLVVVLEDLHWSDAATRDLVTYLVNMVTDERLAFLCSVRSGELDPDHAAQRWVQSIVGSRLAAILELPNLTAHQAARQMREIAGADVADDVAGDIYTRSGGNPFFVEELMGVAASGSAELPPSLRELLLGRVSKLDEAGVAVLEAIAVAGSEVPHGLLLAATGSSEREITRRLRAALDHHLLVRIGGDAYAFRHALLRETVYARVLPGRRRVLHRAFAEALEASQPGTANPWDAARLARHWQQAGQPDRALPHALAAGHHADTTHASHEALQHYVDALDMWDEVANPEQLSGSDHASLLEAAADAAVRARAPARAVDLYRKALTLVDGGWDPQRAAALRISLLKILGGPLMDEEAAHRLLVEAKALLDGLPPTREQVFVLCLSATSLSLTGSPDEGVALAERALDVARHIGDGAAKTDAHAALGLAHCRRGQPERALDHLREAQRIARQRCDTALLGHTSVNLSMALFEAGRGEEAVGCAMAAMEELAGLGDASFEAFLKCNAAEFQIALGRWDAAEALIAPLDESPVLREHLFARLLLAEIDVERGRFERACATIELLETDLDDDLAGPRAQPIVTSPLLLKASMALWERRHDDASNLLHQGWEVLERRPELLTRAWPLGARVEADRAVRGRSTGSATLEREALERGAAIEQRCAAALAGSAAPSMSAMQQLAGAEASRMRGACEPDLWSAVVGAFDALGYRYRAAYARYRHGESLLQGRDNAAAADVLSAALVSAREMGAMPLALTVHGLARRARLRLPDVGRTADEAATPVTAPQDPLGLTKREVEVLRHLSDGLTNKQLGEVLFISPKTVSIHVSSILSKLGVSSRTEAARRAYDSGLLERPDEVHGQKRPTRGRS